MSLSYAQIVAKNLPAPAASESEMPFPREPSLHDKPFHHHVRLIGEYLPFVDVKQLEFFVQIYQQARNQAPDLFLALENEQAYDPALLSPEQWQALWMAFNNAMCCVSGSIKTFQVPLQLLAQNVPVHELLGPVCGKHLVGNYVSIHPQEAVLPIPFLDGEHLPDELHPSLTTVLQWLLNHTSTFTRLFRIHDVKDKIATLSALPFFSWPDVEMLQTYYCDRLAAAKVRHLDCWYCMPNPLALAAHHLSKKYELTVQTIPRFLRPAIPSSANLQAKVSALEQLLESVQTKEKFECIGQAYKHIIEAKWKEVGKTNLLEFDNDTTRNLELLVQFRHISLANL